MNLTLRFFLCCCAAMVWLPGSFLAAQTEDEIAAERIKTAERFKTADADSSGGISREEFRAYIVPRLTEFKRIDEFMDRLDGDKNEQISPAEFSKRKTVVDIMMAEDDAETMPPKPSPTEFEDIYNARFADNKPIVGDTIDELVAFDGQGGKFDFKDLRGKYTVINFGCLT